MSLQVRRTSGNDFTDEDRLETKLTYSGNLHSCAHTINVVSGPDCTHGGGAVLESICTITMSEQMLTQMGL